MKTETKMETNTILQGDCIEKLKELPDNSVDAIVTDPPYGLEFMGKEWDKFKEGKNIAGGTTGKDTPFGRSKPLNSVYQYGLTEKRGFQDFCFLWATECLRVLKPGGFLLSFGGTRTYHRMVCGIEDAGFEIRDTIMWLYGSGFPKSLNIGKQVDKIQGNERKELGTKNDFSRDGAKRDYTKHREIGESGKEIGHEYGYKQGWETPVTKGTSDWEGWGTALKPACEPIVVARKPLSEKNVALNVLKWGTGGINIDACRIDYNGEKPSKVTMPDLRDVGRMSKENIGIDKLSFGQTENAKRKDYEPNQQGRFPANIILDEEAGKMLDEQSGISKSGKNKIEKGTGGIWKKGTNLPCGPEHGDKGGASRYFYCAKASKSERNMGCEEMEEKNTDDGRSVVSDRPHQRGASQRKNNHPTIKPIKLMEYLIKLVSKENAIVLDPFLGSGTTAIACLKQNRKYIGIEKEKEYIEIAEARIKPYLEQERLI